MYLILTALFSCSQKRSVTTPSVATCEQLLNLDLGAAVFMRSSILIKYVDENGVSPNEVLLKEGEVDVLKNWLRLTRVSEYVDSRNLAIESSFEVEYNSGKEVIVILADRFIECKHKVYEIKGGATFNFDFVKSIIANRGYTKPVLRVENLPEAAEAFIEKINKDQ